jgi:hypothetical protein
MPKSLKLFPPDFPTKTLYAFLFFIMCAASLRYTILSIIPLLFPASIATDRWLVFPEFYLNFCMTAIFITVICHIFRGLVKALLCCDLPYIVVMRHEYTPILLAFTSKSTSKLATNIASVFFIHDIYVFIPYTVIKADQKLMYPIQFKPHSVFLNLLYSTL